MSAAADRLAAETASQLERGNEISARDNYLRASNYYRSADFFLHAHADDPRVERAFERSTTSYRRAAALFTPAIEPVVIPFEGTALTGYFHHADASGAPRKTLLLRNGFDGSPEEVHWNGGRAAVERGYNVRCSAVRDNIPPCTVSGCTSGPTEKASSRRSWTTP